MSTVPYPLTTWNKVRNYVLWFRDLKMDLAPIHAHFVSLETGGQPLPLHLALEHGVDPAKIRGKPLAELERLHGEHKLPADEWEYLIADPVGHMDPPRGRKASAVDREPLSVARAYAEAVARKRDLDQHMPRLRELAAQCPHVVEITRRAESSIALLAGIPQSMTTFVFGTDADNPIYKTQETTQGTKWGILPMSDFLAPPIQLDYDLLFFKCPHNYHDLAADLARWAPRIRRWIVLHDTHNHGAKWEDGGPGLASGMQAFLEQQPEWFVQSHSVEQWGLTVLGRIPSDRPKNRVHAWPPGYGPGTEMIPLVHELTGIEPKPTCTCKDLALQMDLWGVDGSRERREMIAKKIRDNAAKWGWGKLSEEQVAAGEEAERMSLLQKASIMAKAVTSGLAFRLNPLDQFGSLVDEAIRRAEAKEAKVE